MPIERKPEPEFRPGPRAGGQAGLPPEEPTTKPMGGQAGISPEHAQPLAPAPGPEPHLTGGKPNTMAGGASILPTFSFHNRIEALITELKARGLNQKRSRALDTLKQLQTELAQEG